MVVRCQWTWVGSALIVNKASKDSFGLQEMLKPLFCLYSEVLFYSNKPLKKENTIPFFQYVKAERKIS